MEERLAPGAEELVSQRALGEEAYVTVRVKNGELIYPGYSSMVLRLRTFLETNKKRTE